MYNRDKAFDKPLFKTNKNWELNEKWYKNYDSAVDKGYHHHILSFEQIGITDPYPKEKMEVNFYIPDNEDDLVYAPARYIEGNSPNAIYYPSKRLMLKMMRSCIGVKLKD